ncbi:MAG: hypothetical protein NTW87_33590 [Planctomycetota bacterium]|nr:hypothetical protein [Planctomycetota bacterium]
MKGHDAKVQADYIWVKDPSNALRGLHDVRNDTFVVSFQLMF